MEEFNEARQLARVSAGLKGGPFFQNPVTHNGKMSFADGWPSEVAAKMKNGTVPQPTPLDVWNQRRSK